MNINRFVNGKPISEAGFKNISIKSKDTEKIISDAAKRVEVFKDKNGE